MSLKKIVLMVFLAFSPFLKGAEFDKVVIWGHKFGTHTHSYIHNGFYIAFKHLGYDTYWFDNLDDVSEFDFSNTLSNRRPSRQKYTSSQRLFVYASQP